jgi:DNA-binding NarL/FixJ family response regulator
MRSATASRRWPRRAGSTSCSNAAGSQLLVDVHNDGRRPAHGRRRRQRHRPGQRRRAPAPPVRRRPAGRCRLARRRPLRRAHRPAAAPLGRQHERPALRVAIVDDEPLARLAVRTRLARRPGFEVVAEYGDGDSGGGRPGGVAPGPGVRRRADARPQRARCAGRAAEGRRPMAILLTAYDGYALQAFELAAIDYLLKPIDDERLDEALERALNAFPYRRRRRGAAVDPHLQRARRRAHGAGAATDVERIEADGDYATLHAAARPIWCANACMRWPCASIRSSSSACTARASCASTWSPNCAHSPTATPCCACATAACCAPAAPICRR